MSRYSTVIIACVGIVIVVATFLLTKRTGSTVSVQTIAETVKVTCENSPESRDVCYEREIPEYFGTLSVPDLFQVIRIVREKDPDYQFCHVLAHKIGELAVAEDKSKWLSLIPLNPSDGLCSNGFIHGIIVGRFRDDVLDDEQLRATLPDFALACEPHENWQPTSLDQAICYHGLGHLFMFITNADYPRALAACTAVTRGPDGPYSRVCREGVFMQTYQPLEPDDFDLIELLPEKPTRENYRRMCAEFDDLDEAACLREAWPLFREDIYAGTGVGPFCSGQPSASAEDACYDTVFAILGRLSQGSDDSGRITTVCGAVPYMRKGTCYAVVAQAFIEENRAGIEKGLEMCEKEGSDFVRNTCYSTLASRAGFIFGRGTQEAKTFCAMIPREWKDICVSSM